MVRLKVLREAMLEQQMEALWITSPENRFYLSGFTGTSGFVLITLEEQYFMTDFRYREQASEQCTGFEVLIHNADETIYDLLKQYTFDHLGFENKHMTVQEYEDLRQNLDSVELKPMGNMLEKIREIKTEEELGKIRRAAEIADEAFQYILTKLRPGVKEREIALELEFFMKQKGATRLSFDTIVASGWRSALPHGVATDKEIETGDFVTMDFGCVYEGYCSDMTRTVVMGSATERQKEIYNLVLKAQVSTLGAIKDGANCKAVDAVARGIIEEAGYGSHFGHGTGHALGLEVHEYPRLSQNSEATLKVNHVVTNEPGIYIPEFGGVRIEDLLVVKEDGYECLSKSPKELIEIQ